MTPKTQKELCEHLIRDAGALTDPRVIKAFERIDRADFVPSEYRDEAYGDYPIPIGEGQTISQPTTVAFMLEKLGPVTGEKILDVGAGSGWTTALLAHIVGDEGKVVGVERVPTLVRRGRHNLEKYGFQNATIRDAGAVLGAADEAPFDRILVSASAPSASAVNELLPQLKEGGTLVAPVGNSIWVVRTRPGKKISREEYPGFVFVPLIT